MENALAVSHVMGPMYLLVGLSMLFYMKSWQHLIAKWAEDHYALFPLQFVMAVFGLISINMYNVWEWNVWLLVTVTGWALFLKGVFYFLCSGSAVKKCLTWKNEPNMLYVGGVVSLAVGAVLSYYSFYV